MELQLELFPDYPRLPPPLPLPSVWDWYEEAWQTLEYPEEDDIPMAQNTQQGEIITYIKGVLDACLTYIENGFVAADLFIHYTHPPQDNAKKGKVESLAPDILLVSGVMSAKKRGSYERKREIRKIQKAYLAEHGKELPEDDIIIRTLVVEVMSDSNYADKNDLAKRYNFYNLNEVDEYLVVHTQPNMWLEMYSRMEGSLMPLLAEDSFESGLAQVRFTIENDALVIRTLEGDTFLHYENEREMRISAQSLLDSTSEALAEERLEKEAERQAKIDAELRAEQERFEKEQERKAKEKERRAKELLESILEQERFEEAKALRESEARYKEMERMFLHLQQTVTAKKAS